MGSLEKAVPSVVQVFRTFTDFVVRCQKIPIGKSSITLSSESQGPRSRPCQALSGAQDAGRFPGELRFSPRQPILSCFPWSNRTSSLCSFESAPAESPTQRASVGLGAVLSGTLGSHGGVAGALPGPSASRSGAHCRAWLPGTERPGPLSRAFRRGLLSPMSSGTGSCDAFSLSNSESGAGKTIQ